MAPPGPPFLFLLLLLSLLHFTSSLSPHPISISPTKSPSAPSPSTSPTPKTTPPSSPSTLDPKQLRALQSLNIPTAKDPCSRPANTTPATACDGASPFRHLVSLRLANCSDDVQLSATALRSLSTLTDLQFVNCPATPIRLPAELSSNLRSLICVNSLRRLTGVWLSRMHNLTDLTVTGVPVTASGPSVFLGSMKGLRSVTVSASNLTGFLPRHWHSNLTRIDLSRNRLRGRLPASLARLENLESLDLSSNAIDGGIPASFGDLLSLQNISMSSNSLSGPLPGSMASMVSLVRLDLGSNQLNGTIPKFISEMRNLKYLNLERNNFNGVLPFNASFIKRLAVFRVGENSNLCYNRSTLPPKVKLGIAPCDRHGLPISPPPAKDSSAGGGESPRGDSADDDYSIGDESDHKESRHGPSKVVLGVAIGLSSIVFLIVFLVLLSKWCG